MTATLHDLLKNYREGGVFPSYDQLAAIAGQDQSGAAVRGKAVAEVLKEARAFIEANSGEVGYGFHRPANPHEFHPDAEMCSAEEIAAHKAACEAYDKGEFKQDSELGWIGPNVHVLTAPWGIGSYAYRSEEAEGMLAKIDAALSDRAADAPSEPSESLCAAVMNIPCERTMSHFVSQAEMRTYREGHRDALCATIDVIAELEAQLAECVALSQKWASAAGEADGRAEKLRVALEYYADPKTNAPGSVAREALAASSQPTDPTINYVRSEWESMCRKAVAVLNKHIVPDGISDHEALNELYGIFDSEEYRATGAIEQDACEARQAVQMGIDRSFASSQPTDGAPESHDSIFGKVICILSDEASEWSNEDQPIFDRCIERILDLKRQPTDGGVRNG